MTSVNEDNRQVACRRTGRHIASVLLVSWAVGNDELSFSGREISVGYVDRDALLSFRLQAICKQRRVKVATCRAMRGRILFKRFKSILVD